MTASYHAAEPVSPGIVVRRVGSIDVASLSDGFYPTDFSALLDIGGVAEERGCSCVEGATTLPVNVFLLTLPSGLALVDAGAGAFVGPTLGEARARLAGMGFEPVDIRYVLMTHLHPDHVGGLVEEDGTACYPNAEILIGVDEAAFWLDGPIGPGLSERTALNMTKARAALKPYGGRIRRVSAGEGPLGASAVALPGHTPGHLGWMVDSGGDRLLLWGDVVHFTHQIDQPDATVIFDVDRDAARATRLKLFELVVRDGLDVAGAHLACPGFHTLSRSGAGFALAPLRTTRQWGEPA